MATSYSQTPEPYSQVPGETNTMAIVSLIAGVVSWIMLPLIAGIVAVVTGHMAKRQIRESAGTLTGDGLATAGLVLGYLNIGVTVIGACIFLALLATGVALPFLCFPFSNEFSRLLAPLFGL